MVGRAEHTLHARPNGLTGDRRKTPRVSTLIRVARSRCAWRFARSVGLLVLAPGMWAGGAHLEFATSIISGETQLPARVHALV